MLSDLTLLGVLVSTLGAILALGGYGLAYYFYRRTRLIRQLTFTFKSPTTLNVHPTELSDKLRKTIRPLRIFYGDQEVRELSIVEIMISNMGGEPVRF
jgi:hypothetical protein